jgi:hypothetical protein
MAAYRLLLVVSYLACSLILKIEAVCAFKILGFIFGTMWCYNPEDIPFVVSALEKHNEKSAQGHKSTLKNQTCEHCIIFQWDR